MARRSGSGPHPRGKKRPKHWHTAERARKWDAVDLPDVGSGAEPTGEPRPVPRSPRNRRGHGDAL
jgi:hypothetical protein